MSDEELWRYVRGNVLRATSSNQKAPPSAVDPTPPSDRIAFVADRCFVPERIAVVDARYVRPAVPEFLVCMLPLVWWLGCWSLHVEIAGIRALSWRLEVGCAARSIPALFLQAVCLVDYVAYEAIAFLLMAAMSAWVIVRPNRSTS